MTVGQLAQAVNGRVIRGDHSSRMLSGVRDLADASASELSFCAHTRYRGLLNSTRAAAVLATPAVCEAMAGSVPDGTFIACDDPYLALSHAARLFAPVPGPVGTRHPSAIIDDEATVANDVTLGASVVIEAGAHVSQGCTLEAHAFVGKQARVGARCRLGVGAKVMWGCILGEQVVLQPGAIVGSDGFGFAVDAASGKRYPIPQLGNVVIGREVDIGSNACIDRATFGSTTIGAGTKIDNLVQVAHNCQIGQDCVMTAQSGVAGSSSLGARVLVGAQGGIAGHITIADDVKLAARAGVPSSIDKTGVYGGTPTQTLHDWRRSMAALRRLPEALMRLARLEARLPRNAETPAEEHS